MERNKAKEISESLGGSIHQREDGSWLVLFERADGRIVVVLDDAIEEYADLDDLAASCCYACISLV